MEATNALSSDGHGTTAPQSRLLHVLMMHGDDIIMSLLDKKLYICLHKVAIVDKEAKDVLRILKEKASASDMLICEVVDSAYDDKVVWGLIKHIESTFNIPLKLVSPSSNHARVLNRTSDAYRYTSVGHMQYAVEKKMVDADPQMDHLRSTSVGTGGDHVAITSKIDENITSSNEGVWKNKDNSDSHVGVVCSNRPKRQRVVWSPELSQAFDDAVLKLGIENAVPKKILELMNWPGLTRENVASHLQKYRLNMKKKQNVVQVQQNESSYRRRKSTSNPATGNIMTTDPFKLRDWSEPVIFQTPQLNIHGCDSSSMIFMEGARQFDIMGDMAHLDYSYIYDENIDLINKGFGWDPQVDIRNYHHNEIENSYGGASGSYWSNNSDSVVFVHDGVTDGLIDESVSQRCLLKNDQFYDNMSYKVRPHSCASFENNECINIGQHQDNYLTGINSVLETNVAQQGGAGGSYTRFTDVSDHVNKGSMITRAERLAKW